MTLWDKGRATDRKVIEFTVGNDYILDKRLVRHDCIASIAHAKMLAKAGILTKQESAKLKKSLREIISLDRKGKFEILQSDEDCHTAIEGHLTRKLGPLGKKIHTGRSRNDQVLTAIRLYEKDAIKAVSAAAVRLRAGLARLARANKNVRIPGYTHMQKAMPSSIEMWLGSFASLLEDDLELLDEVSEIIDQSPLGSAAGFGVPVIPVDRNMTAREMKFEKAMDNPMKAQASRGKFEGMLIHALSQIMLDLNRLATDMMLFSMQEFGYISLPEKMCTGSSIMPQKKNPDVLELVRAKYHAVLSYEAHVMSTVGNLMSGYNRDIQLTKEPLFRAIDTTMDCINIMALVVAGIRVDNERCKRAMTRELYATEEAYKLVMKGMPFRDAYRMVGKKYS